MNEVKSMRDLISSIKSVTIQSPAFKECMERLREVHIDSRDHGLHRGLMIFGPSGVGKTFCATRFKEEHPDEKTPNGLRRRVVLSELTGRASVGSFVSDFLRGLGCLTPSKGTIQGRIEQALTLCKEIGVEIVIIDEINHIVDKKTNRIVAEVADLLKSFINQANVAFVVTGISASKRLLEVDDQLARRFVNPIELGLYDYDSADGRKTFRILMAALQNKLPMPFDGALSDDTVAMRMHASSGGRIGRVMDLVGEATKIASKRSSDKFNLEDLARAHKIVISEVRVGAPNPFLCSPKDVVPVVLDNSNEPIARRSKRKVPVQTIGELLSKS